MPKVFQASNKQWADVKLSSKPNCLVKTGTGVNNVAYQALSTVNKTYSVLERTGTGINDVVYKNETIRPYWGDFNLQELLNLINTYFQGINLISGYSTFYEHSTYVPDGRTLADALGIDDYGDLSLDGPPGVGSSDMYQKTYADENGGLVSNFVSGTVFTFGTRQSSKGSDFIKYNLSRGGRPDSSLTTPIKNYLNSISPQIKAFALYANGTLVAKGNYADTNTRFNFHTYTSSTPSNYITLFAPSDIVINVSRVGQTFSCTEMRVALYSTPFSDVPSR